MKFEGTDYSRRTCISITANGLQIAEGGEYEALNLIKPQMMIRINTVQFTTTPPLLAMCCYTLFVLIFCAVENHLIINLYEYKR